MDNERSPDQMAGLAAMRNRDEIGRRAEDLWQHGFTTGYQHMRASEMAEELVLREFTAWARATFPAENMVAVAKHLVSEVEELLGSPTGPESAGEHVDVFVLAQRLVAFVRDSARARSINLTQACIEKLEICRSRTWADRGDGVYEHVDDESDDAPSEVDQAHADGFRAGYQQAHRDMGVSQETNPVTPRRAAVTDHVYRQGSIVRGCNQRMPEGHGLMAGARWFCGRSQSKHALENTLGAS